LNMSILRIIFEHGIEVGQSPNSVRLSRDGLTLGEIYTDIRDRYGVRPILFTESISSFGNTTRERHSVLTLDGLQTLNLRLSSLTLPQGLPEATYISLLRPMMNVQYTAGALVYHCQELALLYAAFCDQASTLRTVMPIAGDIFTFQDVSEGYYEAE